MNEPTAWRTPSDSWSGGCLGMNRTQRCVRKPDICVRTAAWRAEDDGGRVGCRAGTGVRAEGRADSAAGSGLSAVGFGRRSAGPLGTLRWVWRRCGAVVDGAVGVACVPVATGGVDWGAGWAELWCGCVSIGVRGESIGCWDEGRGCKLGEKTIAAAQVAMNIKHNLPNENETHRMNAPRSNAEFDV